MTLDVYWNDILVILLYGLVKTVSLSVAAGKVCLDPAIKWNILILFFFFSSYAQLEKMIGKLKTEKYGSRILEEIAEYAGKEQPENTAHDYSISSEGQGSEKKRSSKRQKSDEDQVSENRATKKLKTKKAVVLIESSGDET